MLARIEARRIFKIAKRKNLLICFLSYNRNFPSFPPCSFFCFYPCLLLTARLWDWWSVFVFLQPANGKKSNSSNSQRTPTRPRSHDWSLPTCSAAPCRPFLKRQSALPRRCRSPFRSSSDSSLVRWATSSWMRAGDHKTSGWTVKTAKSVRLLHYTSITTTSMDTTTRTYSTSVRRPPQHSGDHCRLALRTLETEMLLLCACM